VTDPTAASGAGIRMQTVVCPSCGRRNRVPAAASGVPRCAACATMLPWLTAADDRDFDPVVTDSSVPVLVDVWAPWCGPCRVVAPGVERAARAFAGRLKAVKVNVDEAPGIAARFDAQAIPTLLLLDHGQERGRQIGALAPDALVSWVNDEIGRVGT
jgi:thioredoxin 2